MEIKLSQLQDRAQFEQAVAEHIARLKAFVSEVGKPRPVAHPLIEASIKRISYPKADKKPDEYVADYTIVDDTPPPPPPLSLEDRKRALFAQLRVAENAAKEQFVPEMKRRLLVLRYQRAMGTPEETRDQEQARLIEEYHALQKAVEEIEYKGAAAESDLADLTEDTIDSWQVPNFG